MTLLSTATRASYLKTLGFKGGAQVYNFQKGWNLGTWLSVDGIYGPATDAALRRSYANHQAGRGDASAHFSFSEFKCQCPGYSGCPGVWEHRVHIKRLEILRAKVGTLRIVSGGRCPQHNKAVGGATSSQHMLGTASDIPGQLTIATMKSLKQFAGIGYSLSTGRVLHVDSRDVSGHNSTGGSPSNPTIWRYA